MEPFEFKVSVSMLHPTDDIFSAYLDMILTLVVLINHLNNWFRDENNCEENKFILIIIELIHFDCFKFEKTLILFFRFEIFDSNEFRKNKREYKIDPSFEIVIHLMKMKLHNALVIVQVSSRQLIARHF